MEGLEWNGGDDGDGGAEDGRFEDDGDDDGEPHILGQLLNTYWPGHAYQAYMLPSLEWVCDLMYSCKILFIPHHCLACIDGILVVNQNLAWHNSCLSLFVCDTIHCHTHAHVHNNAT